MPVGLQVVGRPDAEEGVLALAATLQRANPIGLPRADRILEFAATQNVPD
jgi:Asp-tRNA(Asn)/Glu-tRNA(Gln) amidotransferase A subunit family amidase